MMPPTRKVERISVLFRHALLSAMLFAIAVLAISVPLQAQTFTVLYSFGAIAKDGLYPSGDLIRDSAGNLYGTTLLGGASDGGTVFKVAPSGSEVFQYSFTALATFPDPGLLRDAAGNLYGTGATTVFEVSPSGTETVLHTFGSGSDGQSPSRLIGDASGNFYGTTETGGANNQGTVFKVDRTGSETVLYSFAGGADGSVPIGGLVRDAAGNLYGTTAEGGTGGCIVGCGTIFKIDASGNHTVLYTFNGTDAWGAKTSLTRDKAGNLYGTSDFGGVGSTVCKPGCGTVFKLDTNNILTVLHTFGASGDGITPHTTLIRDAAGNLYGTTQGGGAYNHGTVFKLSPTGKETILHSFNGNDGMSPIGGLFKDATGNLYGCASEGGAFRQGTIFMITP